MANLKLESRPHKNTLDLIVPNMAEVVPGQRHDRRALILFGSETGNSEDVAECLGQVVERLHFVSRVCEMNEVDLVCLSYLLHVILYIAST